MFGLPGGNSMFERANKGMIIISGLMYGLYATCYGIFINIVLNLKTQGIIINIGIYIIQLIFSTMFKYGYMYDTSILPKGLLNIYRLLMPFNYCNYALGTIFLRSRARTGVNYETMSQIVRQIPCSWKTFTSPTQVVGFIRRSIKFTAPAAAYSLLWQFLQSVTFLVCSWFFAEWLPYNASTCRPPWRLIYQLVTRKDGDGYTIGQIQESNKQKFKDLIDGRIRQQLTEEQARKCLRETPQQCD